MSHSSLPCVPIVCEIVPITIGMDVVIFKNLSIQKNPIFIFQNNFEPIYRIFLFACNKHLVVMELVFSNAPSLH
jgi:hypothetical protein